MPTLAFTIPVPVGIGLAIVAAIILIRGLWRATAVQKGTGCPICDAHTGCSHDHDQEHDQEAKDHKRSR